MHRSKDRQSEVCGWRVKYLCARRVTRITHTNRKLSRRTLTCAAVARRGDRVHTHRQAPCSGPAACRAAECRAIAGEALWVLGPRRTAGIMPWHGAGMERAQFNMSKQRGL